jgi:HEPN domain-containing protein
MYPLPLDIICFHCQQTAEKMLKGFVVMQNVRPQKTHDLVELRNLCETYEKRFHSIESECESLNQYGVMPCYPKEFETTEHKTCKAIDDAKIIVSFVKSLFSDKQNENKTGDKHL